MPLDEVAIFVTHTQNNIGLSNNFDMRLLLIDILVGFVGFAGIISSFSLLIKSRHLGKHNFYLGVFLLSISLLLLEVLIFWIPWLEYMPQVIVYRVLFYSWGPSYYFYLYYKLLNKRPNEWSFYFHYTPFFLTISAPILLGNIISPQSHLGQLSLNIINSYPLKALHILVYITLGMNLIHTTHLKTKQKRLKVVLWMTVFMLLMSIILFIILFFSKRNLNHQVMIYVVILCILVFVSIMSFSILTSFKKGPSSYFEIKESEKYKNSSLSIDMIKDIRGKLIVLLKEDKVYLDSSITLEKVSNLMDFERYTISQVINQEFDKNFNQLINDYRIEHAVDIIDKVYQSDNKQNKIKVIDLIYDSGFNNKVTFYKAFKDRIKMTPKAYIEKATKYQHANSKENFNYWE